MGNEEQQNRGMNRNRQTTIAAGGCALLLMLRAGGNLEFVGAPCGARLRFYPVPDACGRRFLARAMSPPGILQSIDEFR